MTEAAKNFDFYQIEMPSKVWEDMEHPFQEIHRVIGEQRETLQQYLRDQRFDSAGLEKHMKRQSSFDFQPEFYLDGCETEDDCEEKACFIDNCTGEVISSPAEPIMQAHYARRKNACIRTLQELRSSLRIAQASFSFNDTRDGSFPIKVQSMTVNNISTEDIDSFRETLTQVNVQEMLQEHKEDFVTFLNQRPGNCTTQNLLTISQEDYQVYIFLFLYQEKKDEVETMAKAK